MHFPLFGATEADTAVTQWQLLPTFERREILLDEKHGQEAFPTRNLPGNRCRWFYRFTPGRGISCSRILRDGSRCLCRLLFTQSERLGKPPSGSCPIDASLPHRVIPFVCIMFMSPCALKLWCSKHDFLSIGLTQKHHQGSTSSLNRSSRKTEH